jgi:hypothetical protein
MIMIIDNDDDNMLIRIAISVLALLIKQKKTHVTTKKKHK